MKVSGFTFDALLYEGPATLVYAGTRDSDRAPVVGKLFGSGQRDLTREYIVLEKVAGPGVVEVLGHLRGRTLVLELSHDGRGIAWDKHYKKQVLADLEKTGKLIAVNPRSGRRARSYGDSAMILRFADDTA